MAMQSCLGLIGMLLRVSSWECAATRDVVFLVGAAQQLKCLPCQGSYDEPLIDAPA